MIALLCAQSLAQAQESRRILYGVSTSISHLPVWVGKDTGLFARNGLNIEPVQIRGGAVSTMPNLLFHFGPSKSSQLFGASSALSI